MSAIGRSYTEGKNDEELIGCIGFGEIVEVDKSLKRKVLITGANSYIGNSFIQYAKKKYPDNFEIDELDMLSESWKNVSFAGYDIVYHVAGIAHVDIENVSDDVKEKYYKVNTDLTVEVAQKAKIEGVKEFIFMSSMIVYGDSAPYGKKKIINEKTVPMPANFYGDSKLQADVEVRELATESFKVLVLRPPMIYGPRSTGNYLKLSKIAKKIPVFPNIDNERSMLFIGNLCEFLCQIMLVKTIKSNAIVLMPQNREWVKTSDMVKVIATVANRRIVITKFLNFFVKQVSMIPNRFGKMANKAFGSESYDLKISYYPGISYMIFDMNNSIQLTEGEKDEDDLDY